MNELNPEFLTINAFNPWAQHDSSPRGVMLSGHIAQALCIEGAEPRRCQTGVEKEFGKYTFSIKTTSDIVVIKVIPKYRRGVGANAIHENPYSLLIFEDLETKEIGILELIKHSLAVDIKHQHFGFDYKYDTELLANLKPGSVINKGTILADSPNLDSQGNYNIGVEANIALMSIPGVIEDGYVVSESFINKIKTKGIEKRTIQWGKGHYPLNLYGDANSYKPFPDIGDKIRSDGLLFSLRGYDDYLAPVEMSKAALMNPDYIFDKLVYGIPNAKVIDITVHHNEERVPPTPEGMEVQADKYYQNLKVFYQSVIDVYSQLQKQRGTQLQISPEYHRLIVEASGYLEASEHPILKNYSGKVTKRKIKKTHRRKDIDDWRVELTFEYAITPSIGYKLTLEHGDKGVICGIWKDSDMPTDGDGNVADIIGDADSTIKRMNIGRLYEQYYNAASRDVSKSVRVQIANDPSDENYHKVFDYLVGYYECVSPKMAALFTSGDYNGSYREHVDSVIKDGVYLWVPTDNPKSSKDIVKDIRSKYPATLTPVTYRGVTTVLPVLIGSMYLLLLEKTGSDWSAVSSAKLQHFGIPARISNTDKFSAPGRLQPVRMLGESEVRLFNATIGPDATMDLLDQSNSPATHKEIVKNILLANKPTNIDCIVDRTTIPLGNSRNLLFVKHMLECAGIEFVREIDDPIRASDMEKKYKELLVK